jgi:hypothetical protein
LPIDITTSAEIFIAIAGICLDQLLEQHSALQEPDFSFDLPPPRGGLRSLPFGAVCLAAEISNSLRPFNQSPTNS